MERRRSRSKDSYKDRKKYYTKNYKEDFKHEGFTKRERDEVYNRKRNYSNTDSESRHSKYYKKDTYKDDRYAQESTSYETTSNRSNNNRSSLKQPLKDLSSLRRELRNFLEEQANIRQLDDFWQFYEKYERMQALRNNLNTTDKEKLFNVDFSMNVKLLYEKLPILDRDGERLNITYEQFKKLIFTIKVYQDFQQKNKFAKLKKLRDAQNELPMAQFKQHLIEVLKKKRVVLIAGDTGCGKSTQVPQYVLEAGYKKIVCTQPRRIACVSLAKRVAYETLSSFTDTVGYQIRFEKSKKADTKVIFMTEGLLLRHASDEETLKTYDVIILDEVHERHLYGDFLVGIMKCLLQKRDDFKLILMSATININLFKNYFEDDDMEVIEVPGRLYPIEINYCPIIKDPYDKKRADRIDCTPYLRIIQMIDQKYDATEKGDLLIFLNGFSEISTLADAVNDYAQVHKNWIVLTLHSSLSLEEQDKVFDYPPNGIRKCIISTNIAETSVTIDGVRFVIDSGKVNRMSYVTCGGINKLTEVVISQDSAKQRSGRAGRTGPGICFRLYSEEDFNNFEAFTPAEIHLVPLDSLFLHMISLGLTDLSNFPFLEKPDDKSIEESLEKLKSCGALSLNKDYLELTPLGEALSQLPVDLTIGKMLIMSSVFGNVTSCLVLAALLSVQSPITQQAIRSLDASELLKPLDSNHGDPISLLNYYKEWLVVKQITSVSDSSSRRGHYSKRETSKQWAKKRGLEEQRFYEVTKLFGQFRDILIEAQLLPKNPDLQLSKDERIIRNGELKQLKSLRYQLKNESKSTRRKQLKFDSYFAGDESNIEVQEKADLRDVEFRILNDSKHLEKLQNETSTNSSKNLLLLKLVLTSGFYPQFALEDEFNSSKTVSEKLFHTKNKHYVFLRPFCYFTLNPDVLDLHNDDIEVPPAGYFSKRPLSRRHQILVYQSILETKKVYLVNVMRMPALQSLLLFSRVISTNVTLTKFAFDDFLLVDVPYFGQGKTLLLRAIQLRKKWMEMLEAKLKNPDQGFQSKQNEEEIIDLVEDLCKYLQTDVVYNIKRLLPADLNVMYYGSSDFYKVDLPNDLSTNPFDSTYTIVANDKLGGLQVTENVVYKCLVQEEWEYELEEQMMNTAFECPVCLQLKPGLAFYDMLQHESQCKSAKQKEIANDFSESSPNTIIKPNSRKYHCDKCNKDLMLTPVEILKHKKSCL